MSVKKYPVLFLFLVVSGLCTYLYMTSSDASPKHFEPYIHMSQLSSRGVVDRIIQLKFNTKHVDKMTEVSAYVSVPFDYEGELQYKWTLGQNVILTEGQLTGKSANHFRRNEPQEIKVTVNGFDPSQLRHIGFEIWADKNGRRIFAEGLVSSQKENSFEDIVQHVEKLKAKKSGIHK